MRWCKSYKRNCFAPYCRVSSPDKCGYLYECKSMNELLGCLKGFLFHLTSGDIPIKVNGKEISSIEPELEGENGDYWCNLIIKE